MTFDPAQADRSIVDQGTDEQTWRDWDGWAAPLESLGSLVAGRLIVVAPHPDDEVLGAGGLLWAAAQQDRAITVVAVTAGDASHPNSARWPVHSLRAQRRFERANALAQLGVSDATTVECEVPDGQVTGHLDRVTEQLADVIEDGDTVVSPWRWDGHPDHEATTTAVLKATEGRDTRMLQMPIWGWHWADPQQFPTKPRLFGLSPDARLAKERAVSEYRSQLERDPSTGAGPILPSWALARLIRDVEVYFDA